MYDFDESETTDTLDAPLRGVDYNIPFDLIAAVALPTGAGDSRLATIGLQSGEQLSLERSGDLGDRNGGLLVFAGGRERPDYVRWSDVARIDFERPPSNPAGGGS